MANSRRGTLRVVNGSDWAATELVSSGVRRGAASEASDQFVTQLAATKIIQLAHAVEVSPRRGAAPSPAIRLAATTAAEKRHVLMVRHASGAITFHLPVESERRGQIRHLRFTAPVPQAAGERRGLMPGPVRAFLLEVAGIAAEKTVPALGTAAETLWWRARNLSEGWKRISASALASGAPLPAATPGDFSADPSRPNLLLLHGTFSHAASAFARLASARASSGGTFFDFAQKTYGSRLFGFDHFSVSRSPAENVQALLAFLPPGPCTFDVVTHSRGGLVLRLLAELPQLAGPHAARFRLRRAALVAAPNDGTPLASPQRFDHFLTWIANLVDLLETVPALGGNPLVMGVGFVADGLSWVANHVLGALPGLAAMDPNGELILALQSPPSPEPTAYSALTSNFEPEKYILARTADAGVDAFFNSANDLVVPTEGGWHVDPGVQPARIPATRIGCFGRGGNLAAPPDGPVMHTNFFSRSTTVDFLIDALSGVAQPYPPLDPSTRMPFGLRRSVVAAIPALTPAAAPAASAAATVPRALAEGPASPAAVAERHTDEVFYLTVMNSNLGKDRATLFAQFRNASVTEEIHTRGEDSGKRFRDIIKVQHDIRAYVDGTGKVDEPPRDKELIEVGRKIFDTLFPAEVRRLYDIARASQRTGRLNIIFTSQIDWVADLPWEFIYDPGREVFLATSELNFTRNVITAVPADHLENQPGRLRILVVVAQPIGLAHLSVHEEIEVIRAGFKRLIDGELATVEVLTDATADALHRRLEISEPFDIVHFIGHGEFDKKDDQDYLIFQDAQGRMQRVNARNSQEIFSKRGIRLVFLNACETAEGGRAEFNRGLAQALVAGGVPCVVANQYSVLDVSATSFAQHFYWALAHGMTIGDATRESRIAVNYSISGESIDWAVPVVFARNPADRLAQPRTHGEAVVAAAIRSPATASRRRSAGRERIGLWDVQRLIPHLDRIARRLTDCQDRFFFEPVTFSAPLGTWRREWKGKGPASLHAEKLAKRLASKPDELGVKSLIAITGLPLRDSDTPDLESWWNHNLRIGILSMYDYLDQLPSDGYTIERAVANAVAGFLAGLDTIHKSGEKEGKVKSANDCPLFYNGDQEIRYFAGPLHCCPLCRKRLKDKRNGKLIPVLGAILAAYSE
jgi:hypothetical protein